MATKTINVDVRATEGADGKVEFSSWWRHSNGAAGVWKAGAIDLPYGPDEYKLVFDLDDKSGKNLKFYGDPEKAMYVRVGSNCPTQPGSGQKQIEFISVDPHGKKKLTVKDRNQDPPRVLQYMLRFDGDPSTDQSGENYPPYEYDPEIRNGGGGNLA